MTPKQKELLDAFEYVCWKSFEAGRKSAYTARDMGPEDRQLIENLRTAAELHPYDGWKAKAMRDAAYRIEELFSLVVNSRGQS